MVFLLSFEFAAQTTKFLREYFLRMGPTVSNAERTRGCGLVATPLVSEWVLSYKGIVISETSICRLL